MTPAQAIRAASGCTVKYGQLYGPKGNWLMAVPGLSDGPVPVAVSDLPPLAFRLAMAKPGEAVPCTAEELLFRSLAENIKAAEFVPRGTKNFHTTFCEPEVGTLCRCESINECVRGR